MRKICVKCGDWFSTNDVRDNECKACRDRAEMLKIADDKKTKYQPDLFKKIQ
jgi:hypothetical protein